MSIAKFFSILFLSSAGILLFSPAAEAAGNYNIMTYMRGGRSNYWEYRTTAYPSGRTYQASVWTGSEFIIWGGRVGNNGTNTGARYNPSTNTWKFMSIASAPLARDGPAAVWTGTYMFIWGGSVYTPTYSKTNTGALYDPVNDVWKNISTTGAPSAREGEVTVWDGTYVTVWGGYTGSGTCTNTGGRYNPSTDMWTTMAASPLSARCSTAWTWTGTQFFVWGGFTTGWGDLADGALYNPTSNTWSAAVSTTGSPTLRRQSTAVWTGTDVIVWGGTHAGTYYQDGYKYNVSGNTWTAISTTSAPSARVGHNAVYTGSKMVIWGGGDAASSTNTGGIYNLSADTWTATSTGANVPSARADASAAWTGTYMVVWGGTSDGTGGRFNPTSNSWLTTATGTNPTPRKWHTAVWSGSEMIVWGGEDGNGNKYNTGGKFNPTSNTWTATGTGANVPSAREFFSAVWSTANSRMVIWGGYDGTWTNTGSQYDPVGNSWTAMTTASAPSSRDGETTVWTGSKMIVWGGYVGGSQSNTGGMYDPSANTWTATSTGAGVPSARYYHMAAWSTTNSRMVIWGGYDDTAGVGGQTIATGAMFDPSTNTWPTVVNTTGAPSSRMSAAAIWTGSKMLIQGGEYVDAGTSTYTALTDGFLLDPSTNTWSTVSSTNSPGSLRDTSSTAWTGSVALLWDGGRGALYNPTSNSWTTMSEVQCPGQNSAQQGVWTGSILLIFPEFDGVVYAYHP